MPYPYPVVPETITVHLGAPGESARNVVVPFAQYIKNVASHEIYPTWPESAIRANILAQISYALNRVYTEYYRVQRVRLRHHLHHPVRSGLCGGRRHIREHQPHRGRYFQQLHRAAGQCRAAVRPVLRRGAYPVQWPVPMGQRGSGGGGHDALRNFAVLLRRRHQSGDECAGGRERGLLFGAAPAAGRCRQRRAAP